MLLSKAVTRNTPKYTNKKPTKHQLFRFNLKVQAESSWGSNRVAPSHMSKSEQQQRIFLLGRNAYGYLEPLSA